MVLVRVKLPETDIRNPHFTLHERTRPGPTCRSVGSGGPAPALGNVNRARNGPNAAALVVSAGRISSSGAVSRPFGKVEEEEGFAPPALLAFLDFSEGFVSGDGLL